MIKRHNKVNYSCESNQMDHFTEVKAASGNYFFFNFGRNGKGVGISPKFREARQGIKDSPRSSGLKKLR